VLIRGRNVMFGSGNGSPSATNVVLVVVVLVPGVGVVVTRFAICSGFFIS